MNFVMSLRVVTILVLTTCCLCVEGPIKKLFPQQLLNDKSGFELSTPPACGKPYRKLSSHKNNDGFKVTEGQFPWMVALGYSEITRDNMGYIIRESWPDWRCTGSLITSRHVLTAAHCVCGFEIELRYARMGMLNVYNSFEKYIVNFRIIGKHIHENYNNHSHSNDIAILKLDQDATKYPMIGVICLPFPETLAKNTFTGYYPFVVGWGTFDPKLNNTNEDLFAVRLRVIRNKNCKDNYALKRRAIIDDTVICTKAKRKDSCRGDSGGPLIINDSKSYYAVGIVSYSKGCARDEFPGVNTRVTKYLDWIISNLH